MKAEPASASQRQDLKSGRKLWGPPGLKDRSLTVSERHVLGVSQRSSKDLSAKWFDMCCLAALH